MTTPSNSPYTPDLRGFIAYLDGEPAGWCGVESSCGYHTMSAKRSPCSLSIDSSASLSTRAATRVENCHW